MFCEIEKKAKGAPFYLFVGFLICAGLINGCAQTPMIGKPLDRAELTDGVYAGSYRGGPNRAAVRVTIKDQAIVEIEITEHQAWRGKKAELPTIERIIASQSTNVDAVSGATNSSRVIMNAVQNAIENAYLK
ncbi:MAG: FMN-binding protein [Desulfobacterales bacterium]|nr:FMN-binding protein [Desulfobacterales bacterium]